MTGRLKRLQEGVLDFFFPRQCFGCGKAGNFICTVCLVRSTRILPPICPRCGRPQASGTRCTSCWGSPDTLNAIRSVFIFDGAVRKAVHGLKYSNLTGISGFLADLMAEYYYNYGLAGDMVLPVPLHQSRLKQRGYNQSELLARELSVRIAKPFNNHLLKRARPSPPQARTEHVTDRFENVKDAFTCSVEGVAGICLILVDDVCTSGATLEACAVALKAAGAVKVTGFTLAREI